MDNYLCNFQTIKIENIEKSYIKLYMQNESYYPFFGGSSKARKLQFFIQDIKSKKCNAVVTAGSASSNHARVVALACAENGWDCTIVIHDKEDYSKGNLSLMKLAGAHLIFTELSEVKEIMDNEMIHYRNLNKKPYYIYRGGSGVLGSLAFYEAIKEFNNYYPELKPDYLVHASGTGGTQAGFIVGCNEFMPETKVIGISVARDKKRGTELLKKDTNELSNLLGLEAVDEKKLIFRDDWTCGGYGQKNKKLLEVIKKYASKYGLVTDTTYTGKVVLAIDDMINNNEIKPNSTVLFWHTGSLINVIDDLKE